MRRRIDCNYIAFLPHDFDKSKIKNFNLKKNFLIFSGIGNPEEFERTLIKYKFKIKQKSCEITIALQIAYYPY